MYDLLGYIDCHIGALNKKTGPKIPWERQI